MFLGQIEILCYIHLYAKVKVITIYLLKTKQKKANLQHKVEFYLEKQNKNN